MYRLFVYGSLKPGEPRFNQLKAYAEHRKIELEPQPALTAGLLYAIDLTYPGMVIKVEDSDSLVSGFVLNIGGDPGIIGLLNDIEGYEYNQVENFFEPVQIKVQTSYGDDLRCWTYAFTQPGFDFATERAKKFPINGEQKTKALPLIRIPSGKWEHTEEYFDKRDAQIYSNYINEERSAKKSAE